jgi:DNA-binding CsgD family transcriptional regulator
MGDRSAHAGGGADLGAGRKRSSRRLGAALSKREREILGMLATGISGVQIAERLALSPETVRTHIRNAMSKLGATSRAHAVALAVERGEIRGPAPDAGNGLAPAPSEGGAPATTGARSRARATLAAGEADAALAALLSGLVSLYDVAGGAVYLADEDGLSLRRAAFLGEDDSVEHAHPEQVPLGEGTLGRVALERRAQLLPGSPTATEDAGRATIYAPIIHSGLLLGVICLTTRPSRLTARGDLLLLQAFANRIADVLVIPGRDQRRRLRAALDRFRVSWSAANSAG